MRNVLLVLLVSWSGMGALAHAQTASSGSATAAPRASRVEVRGEWVYVDGEPFLVKGMGYSPYRPGQVPWKDAVGLALVEQDLRRIAEAGFNTIRTWSPLSDEVLALAKRYGLMVLQGIWIERNGNYNSTAFRDTMARILQREAQRAAVHDNILALIVGNELQVPQVYATGIPETEALLRRAAEVVRTTDPQRLVSYANWPSLAFLDASPWQIVCFNLYPYEPASVVHSFGFRGYVEHLKRTVAPRSPLVISEVGLSLSRVHQGKPGYGGYTPARRQVELLTLWDDVFQGGAQGGAIFEWNDEWWKHAEFADDAQTHEDDDPEEWFGLLAFEHAGDQTGTLRGDYGALKTYNQAIILSPVSGQPYRDRLQVTIYAVDQVASVRYHLGRPSWFARWSQATQLSRHWWKAVEPISGRLRAGQHPFIVEAFDAGGRRLVRRERLVTIGPAAATPRVRVTTDHEVYEVGMAVEPVTYHVELTDEDGRPLAGRPVHVAIVEPLVDIDLSRTVMTDAKGVVQGTYLVHEPGIVGISAGTPLDARHPQRRVGEEVFRIVRRQPALPHRASPWEDALPEDVRAALRHEATAFQLADTGTEPVVDYARYGRFRDVGTPSYRYEVTDWEGLSAAAGEGVYPNEAGLLRDPAYQQAVKEGRLTGSHWDFTFLKDVQLSVFKWASADEEPGVKQFYVGLALERAGLWHHAVKAYYALLVHFPASIGWTAFDPPTPWYVGKVARDRIEAILRLHPELGLRLEGAGVVIDNGFDNELDNDTIHVHPGRLARVAPDSVNPPSVDVGTLTPTRTVGAGRVRLVQYENGHWQLQVDGRPWVVRGITYQPSQVGESPDEGTLRDWMTTDRNANGRVDASDTFVDANRNDRQDADEPVVGDAALLKDMGVNTIRLYHHASNKALLRQLYDEQGFMVLMGDLVGMYTVGSGAAWEQGTDYLNTVQRRRMTESVRQMVKEFKDEPYVLMWVLGNENNYGGVHGIIGGVGNAGRYPKEYYSFINELATWIHQEDPNHPVVIANGDLGFLPVMAKHAPAIDVLGSNVYRGWHGPGRSLFEEARRLLDKPVLITEYGCPAYQLETSRAIAERDQAFYHLGNWVDVADNVAGRGVGNALGGVVFEWSDEWWKAGQPPRFSPKVQETVPNWAGPYPGGWNFEEWYGLVSQGNGTLSPYLRQLRTGYRLYQALWRSGGE